MPLTVNVEENECFILEAELMQCYIAEDFDEGCREIICNIEGFILLGTVRLHQNT